MHACAAQRVHTHADLGAADGVHVDHLPQVVHVVAQVVVLVRGGGAQCLRMGHASHAVQLAFQVMVGRCLDALGNVLTGWATVRRVVFETTIARWVVRGCDDDAVGARSLAAAVVLQDGV